MAIEQQMQNLAQANQQHAEGQGETYQNNEIDNDRLQRPAAEQNDMGNDMADDEEYDDENDQMNNESDNMTDNNNMDRNKTARSEVGGK
jgi:hypothetical protein